MIKKCFVAVLCAILCFSFVGCRLDQEEQKEKIIGEWDIPYNVTYDLKPMFKEDGTCIIDGKEYRWALEELRNKVTEYRVYDGEKTIYKVDLSYGVKGYDGIYISKSDEYGFVAADGCYYRGSDYIKVEINNENWKEYFVIKEDTMKVEKNFREEVTSANVSRFLVLRKEYGVANMFISNVTAIAGYNEYNYNYTVDYDNKTYNLSEPLSEPIVTATETVQFTEVHTNGYWRYGIPFGTMEFDGKTSGTIINDFDRKIIDVEGVMYCYVEE